jgi:iron complex transport system substrate-binding protein
MASAESASVVTTLWRACHEASGLASKDDELSPLFDMGSATLFDAGLTNEEALERFVSIVHAHFGLRDVLSIDSLLIDAPSLGALTDKIEAALEKPAPAPMRASATRSVFTSARAALALLLMTAATASASGFVCSSKQPQIAKGFTMEDFGAFKVVNVTADTCDESYVLYARGTPKPALGTTYKYFETPIQGFVATETPPMTFFELLGARDAIKVSSQYTTSACIAKRVEDGLISKYAGPTYNAQTYGYDNNPAFEGIVNNTAYDLIASGPYTLQYWPHAESLSRTICNGDTYETDPMGSAEWIKFWGYFFDADATAASAFCQASSRYTCNAFAANNIAAEAAKLGATGAYAYQVPVGVWASGLYYGSYTVKMVHYQDKFMNDAGATYPDFSAFDAFKSTHWSGSHTEGFKFPAANVSLFHAALAMADFIIDGTYPNGQDKASLTTAYGLDGASSLPPAFTSGRLYTLDGTMAADGPPYGGIDWFESRLAEPDAFLADLIAIAHPTGTNYAPTGLKYLRHVGAATAAEHIIVTSAGCTDASAARAVRASTCGALAASSTSLGWLASLEYTVPETTTVVASMTVAGTVSDITAAIQDTLKATFATQLGVSASAVSLAIAAASVKITATIVVPAADAAAATTTLTNALSTPSAATALFGSAVTVEAVDPVVNSASPAPPAPAASKDDTALIAICIALGVLSLIFGAATVVLYLKKKAAPSTPSKQSQV